MAKVQVVLCSKIRKYGEPGDIVRLAMGYARYLVSIKSALYATEENKIFVKQNLENIIRKDEEKLNEFKAIANKINDIKEIKIIRKANSNGKLHGSVNEGSIIDILNEKGLSVSKTNINSTSIKFVGEHNVSLQFKGGVNASLRLVIEAEAEEGDNYISKQTNSKGEFSEDQSAEMEAK